jgi:transposase-like protein
MLLLATTFLEFWTRKNAYVAYEWHVDEYRREVSNVDQVVVRLLNNDTGAYKTRLSSYRQVYITAFSKYSQLTLLVH